MQQCLKGNGRARPAFQAPLLVLLCVLATETGAQGIGWPDTVGYRHLWAIRNLHGMRQDALELQVHPETWQASPLGMRLQGRADLTAGVLRLDNRRTAFVSVGPAIEWLGPLGLSPVFLELGIAPTLLEDTEFEGGATELGSNFHFTSHASIGFSMSSRRRFTIAYRIQHTSNANTDADNTGVDFEGITARWRFR